MSSAQVAGRVETNPAILGRSLGGFAGSPEIVRRRTSRAALYAFPLVASTLRMIPGLTGDLAYALIGLYALLGRRQAIVSLLLLCFFNLATHSFGGPPGWASIYRHLVVLAAAFSVWGLHVATPPYSTRPRLIAASAGLCGLILIHAVLISINPALSVLKAVSFALTILTLYGAWSRLSPPERRQAESQVWGIVVGLAALSIPLIGTPLGYFKDTPYFEGLLSHSQAFGPVMAVLAVYAAMELISQRRFRPGMAIVALLASTFVVMSRARIGLLILAVGIAAGILLPPFISVVVRNMQKLRIKKPRLAMLAFASLVGFALAGPVIFTKAKQLVFKHGRSDSSAVDAVLAARWGFIEIMMRSIREKPLTGIGFGVPSEGGSAMETQYDPYFGLPIMSVVEKGVMPVAVIEELGWPIAVLVYIWFLQQLLASAQGGPVYLAVFCGAFSTNVAEAVFFSPGGMGLYFLVMITMAATAPGMQSPILTTTTASRRVRTDLQRPPLQHA